MHDLRLISVVRRSVTVASGVLRELRGAGAHATDMRSLMRLCTDIVLFRVLRVWPAFGSAGKLRAIRLDDMSITYRLNRGDIQSIREVWLNESYRLPPDHGPKVVLDLGADIGLTSVWLAKQYGCTRIVGVEPDAGNAALARRNLEANGINGEVVEAAAGPTDGTGFFAFSSHSNLGRLVAAESSSARTHVATLTPESILRSAGLEHVDLCKIDIEGGEGALFLKGDTTWLARVDAIVAELHPTVIDSSAVIRAIDSAGLYYRPPGSTGCKLEFFARA